MMQSTPDTSSNYRLYCDGVYPNSLEKSKRIENTFHHPFYRKKSWMLSNQPEKVVEGLNPFRNKWLDKNYPGIRENEDNL